jgi:hypothetical protein
MASTEIIPFKEPRALAGLAVKPPACSFRTKKPSSGSSVSSPPIKRIGTRGDAYLMRQYRRCGRRIQRLVQLRPAYGEAE